MAKTRMNAELYLAQKLYQAGDAIACEEKCRTILALADVEVAVQEETRLLLARISYDRQDFRKSLNLLAGLQPAGNKQAYLSGLNHYALKSPALARASFERVLANSPDHQDAHRNIGIIDLEDGNVPEAVAHFCRALDIEPTDELTRRNLLDALQSHDWRKVNELEIHRHLVASFRTSNFDMTPYLPVAAAAIRSSEPFRHALSNLASPASGKMLEHAWCADLLKDQLFQSLLKSDVVPLADFEAVLTIIRRTLLEAEDRLLDTAPLDFCIALAHQAFFTEFVYDLHEQEKNILSTLNEHLRITINSSEELSRLDATKLAVSACYGSLGDWLDGVPESFVDAGLGNLARLQILDALDEASLESQIESLAPVAEATSLKVKRQYEENPYPRWSLAAKSNAGAIGKSLQSLFPNFAPPKKMFQRCSILIAGCGTGRQPIQEALRYPKSDITAVDLSRASLAYASRQAIAHGAENIRFLEGDILALDNLKQQFDVIECSGVLHHMNDPLAGWRALIAKLAPDGIMKIGLYSTAARRHITEVRQWIEAQNISPTVEGIRRTRRKILALPADDDKRSVTSFSDFYSLSGVRDLLFHVQESTFSFPQLGYSLDQLNLELIGLQLPENWIKEAFRSKYPGDVQMTDLNNWREFETENPDCFREMYLFWCRLRKKS